MGRRGINSLLCLRRSLSLARVERFASVVLIAVAAVLLSVSLVGCSQPPVPAATESPVPVATEPPVPVATEPSVPVATESPVPVATESPVPVATEPPVPVATEPPVPVATEPPVPVATEPPVPVATEHLLLEASVEAMRNVDSFDFVEENSNSLWEQGGGYYRITGTYQSPNKLSKHITTGRTTAFASGTITPNRYGHSIPPVLGETSILRTISVGDEIYVANPASGDWITDHEAKENYGTGRRDTPWVNPVDTLERVIAEAPRYEDNGEEVLDGVSVRHLTWRTHLIENRRETYRQVDVYIGIEDSLVRKLFIGESWDEVPCDPDVPCITILIIPGSSEYTLEFSYPGDETPIVAPTV